MGLTVRSVQSLLSPPDHKHADTERGRLGSVFMFALDFSKENHFPRRIIFPHPVISRETDCSSHSKAVMERLRDSVGSFSEVTSWKKALQDTQGIVSFLSRLCSTETVSTPGHFINPNCSWIDQI